MKGKKNNIAEGKLSSQVYSAFHDRLQVIRLICLLLCLLSLFTVSAREMTALLRKS